MIVTLKHRWRFCFPVILGQRSLSWLSKSAVTLAEAGLFDQQSGGLRRITID